MTYSGDKSRQPYQSDLSARPREGFDVWMARVRRAAVIDPEFADQEQRRMAAEDQRRRAAAEQSEQVAAKVMRWLLGSLAALGLSVVLYYLTGLTGWIIAVCAVASAASLAAYPLATRRGWSAAALAAPGPVPDVRQAVLLGELDEACRERMARVQRAVTAVVSSSIYANRPADRQADEMQLRRHEWQAAVILRNITLRRAQHDATLVLGKETADVLDRHQRYLADTEQAVAGLIDNLEALAARVKRREVEDRDRENAFEASGRDGSYQDLGASAAAIELTKEEIRDLADKIAPADDDEPS